MYNKAISSYLISLASYILIYFDTLQEIHVSAHLISMHKSNIVQNQIFLDIRWYLIQICKNRTSL